MIGLLFRLYSWPLLQALPGTASPKGLSTCSQPESPSSGWEWEGPEESLQCCQPSPAFHRYPAPTRASTRNSCFFQEPWWLHRCFQAESEDEGRRMFLWPHDCLRESFQERRREESKTCKLIFAVLYYVNIVTFIINIVCTPCWLPMVSWSSEHIVEAHLKGFYFLFEQLHCGWEDQRWNFMQRTSPRWMQLHLLWRISSININQRYLY